MKVFCSRYQKLNFVRSKVSLGAGACLAVDCMDINELEEKVFLECFPGTVAVENFACLELMKTAVKDALSSGSGLLPSALTPGFTRYLLDLYRRVAVAGIPVHEFALRGHEEIGAVLARYRVLTNGREPADIKRVFFENLSGLAPETVGAMGLSELEVIADNFPSRQNLIFLDTLSGIGVKIRLTLPFPKRSEYSYLCEPLSGFDVSFCAPHELEDIDFICALDAADTKRTAPRKPVSVSLLRASGPYREIEQTMRYVRRILDEKGKDINPFDIAVAVPDITAVYQFVEDAALRYDIPVYVRRGISLARTPFVQAFLSLLRLVEGDYDNEQLLDVLNNPYLSRLWQSSDIEEDIRQLRSVIEKEAVLTGARNWVESGNPTAKWVVRVGSSLRPEMTLSSYCRTLEDFVMKCGHGIEDESGSDWRERDRRAREKFLSILNSIAANCGLVREIDRNYSLTEFRTLLESELERHMIRYYPGKLTGVQVLEMKELAGCSFRHVFLLILNDCVVPRRPGAEPVLDSSVLKGLGFETAHDKRAREIASFFAAVYACRGHLYLSWQDSSFDGSERIASYLLDDIMSAFDFGSVPSYGADKMVHPVSEGLSTEDFVHSALCAGSDADECLAALSRVQEKERLVRVLEQCRSFENSLSPDGLMLLPELGNEVREKVRDGTFEISATALSDLLSCPFLWYFRHRLELDKYKRISPFPAPDKLGTGLHACLESIFRFYRTSRAIPENDLYGLVKQELENAWQKSLVRPLGADEKRFAHDFGKDVSAIVSYLEQERLGPSYEVDALEKRGRLSLDVPGGSLTVKCRIDRIDKMASGTLRIIDYKRGKVSSRRSKKNLALQLSVYALCLHEETGVGRDGLMAAGYSFGDGSMHPLSSLIKFCFKIDVMDIWLWEKDSGFRRQVSDAVAGLMEGKISACEDTDCRNCSFAGICPGTGGGQ